MKDKCYYCERPFNIAVYGTDIILEKTKDHVIPKSKGGNNTKTNLVDACNKCNYLKDSYLPIQFADYLKNIIDCYLIFSDTFINLYPIHILERIVNNSIELHHKIEPIKSYCLKNIKAPIGFDVRPKKKLIKNVNIKINNVSSNGISKKSSLYKNKKQEKVYKIKEGIIYGNILNFNDNQYFLIGYTKDGLKRPVYISRSKTTVVIWHLIGGIEYKYSSVKCNINHINIPTVNVQKNSSQLIFKTSELTLHEWLHRYNLEKQCNFHYE